MCDICASLAGEGGGGYASVTKTSLARSRAGRSAGELDGGAATVNSATPGRSASRSPHAHPSPPTPSEVFLMGWYLQCEHREMQREHRVFPPHPIPNPRSFTVLSPATPLPIPQAGPARGVSLDPVVGTVFQRRRAQSHKSLFISRPRPPPLYASRLKRAFNLWKGNGPPTPRESTPR